MTVRGKLPFNLISVAGARRKISLYYCTDIGLTVRVCLKSIAVMQEEGGSSDLRRGPAAWSSRILIDVLILTQPSLMLQLLTM